MNVKVWEEKVVIPTYEVGEADPNPMFLEKRVYQGSSGKVYPYPTTETISHTKVDKTYRAVYLENEYLKVMVLPELGGRIQRAYDKTNDYDFVYYNQVIKPALVGLVGPWISGGIEFNWPQHHRPTTFMPVEYSIRENKDGSKSLLLNDTDQMYGTKSITILTLYPDKAFIEIEGQLYNRTPFAQTFLWWANPAVAVHDETQSIFPPDVHSVYDHGKRDVSRFPIATGTYYKHDYSAGVDISRYKNIPVPTSYMAEKSDYDFVGGYDYSKNAGILHVADHHISPGKKQWTWGGGEFGQAWDRNLTDEDGPYIELMTGVYTDNQPDFTWLKPFEEKVFKQYFMPYKQVGEVKNATTSAILNSEVTDKGVYVCVYTTEVFDGALVKVFNKGLLIEEESIEVSPVKTFEKTYSHSGLKSTDIRVEVEYQGKCLVSYQSKEEGIPELAEPAKAPAKPKDVQTNEELYLIGQHIEQYRHATVLPDWYYEEGLKRDPQDSRINNALGSLRLRQGEFAIAKKFFETAIERLTRMNPNPYHSEAYYNLGLSCFYLGQEDEAYDAFFKATWVSELQEMSFYYLAVIAMRRDDFNLALEFVEKGLVKNSHNIKARAAKSIILRKLNRVDEANQWIEENLKVDAFDYVSLVERYLLTQEGEEEIKSMINEKVEIALQIARDYGEYGCYEEAINSLMWYDAKKPLVYYYKGYYESLLGKIEVAKKTFKEANECDLKYTFPNQLEDILVLEKAMELFSEGAQAAYHLGNLYYDKQQFNKAIALWEKSYELDETNPIVSRNLALGYFNKKGNPIKAKEMMEKAFALNIEDARIFLEKDQLYKKVGVPFVDRLKEYDNNNHLLQKRDDVYIEYITLLNMVGHYQKALDCMLNYTFRPWEGAEGKITTQYKIALLELARESLMKKDLEKAKEYLEQAKVYPKNLGEGRLEGTKDNHLFYTLGVALERLGMKEAAQECFSLALLGSEEPAGMMFYYDQPADMIFYQGLTRLRLGQQAQANQCFYKLLDYGERHFNDKVEIDYFAVSLPDFLIFDEDLDKKNKVHCYYLMGLAKLGLNDKQAAHEFFSKALGLDPNHQHCGIYLSWCDENKELV